MIQIRNVPDEVHRELKVRAAQAGMSLSDFLNAELARLVTRRPLQELLEAADRGCSPARRRQQFTLAATSDRSRCVRIH